MKLLKTLFIGLAVLALLALGGGFLLPDQVSVQRSVLIDSRPATVYTVLNGFRQFNRWSPWADLDPGTIYTYDGPPQGIGSRSSWSSTNPNVGAGSQEILAVKPYQEIKLRLSFDGMDADTVVTYSLKPEGAATRLIWLYDSSFGGNLLGRYFGLILDRMVGPDFEKGLQRLKKLVESLPQDDFAAIAPELIEQEPLPIAYISRDLRLDQSVDEIAASVAQIEKFLEASGRKAIDVPLVVTRGVEVQAGLWKADIGIPVDALCTAAAEDAGVQCGKTYGGWLIRARCVPEAAAIEQAEILLKVYLQVAGLENNGPGWRPIEAAANATASPATLSLYVPVK